MIRRRAAALAAVLFVPWGAGADDRGFYFGAGAGEATIEDHARSFDSRESSYKAFLGYRARTMPLLDLAGEVAYSDYGSARQTVQGQTVQYKIRGSEFAGLAIVPLGPLDLYGKAGLVSWSSSRSIDATNTSQSGSNGFYGAGVAFRAGKLGVRAEYNEYDVSAVDRLRTYVLSWFLWFY
jgi:hypothetical protein